MSTTGASSTSISPAQKAKKNCLENANRIVRKLEALNYLSIPQEMLPNYAKVNYRHSDRTKKAINLLKLTHLMFYIQNASNEQTSNSMSVQNTVKAYNLFKKQYLSNLEKAKSQLEQLKTSSSSQAEQKLIIEQLNKIFEQTRCLQQILVITLQHMQGYAIHSGPSTGPDLSSCDSNSGEFAAIIKESAQYFAAQVTAGLLTTFSADTHFDYIKFILNLYQTSYGKDPFENAMIKKIKILVDEHGGPSILYAIKRHEKTLEDITEFHFLKHPALTEIIAKIAEEISAYKKKRNSPKPLLGIVKLDDTMLKSAAEFQDYLLSASTPSTETPEPVTLVFSLSKQTVRTKRKRNTNEEISKNPSSDSITAENVQPGKVRKSEKLVAPLTESIPPAPEQEDWYNRLFIK